MTVPLNARDLGSRGSRGDVADPDPAGPPPGKAAAVLAAVPAWWEARAREAGLSGRWLDVKRAIAAPPPEAIDLAEPDASVTSALSGEDLGVRYVTALSPAVRARHGRHYTPPELAEHLWTMTRGALGLPLKATKPPGLIRDRACGAGALLLPPLREYVRASPRLDVPLALAALPNIIEGIDSDPNAVWLANVVMAAEVLPLLAAVPSSLRKPLPSLAHCGDGLEVRDRLARVELQNPPYGRVRLSPDDRERWSHVLYGHANLYGLFIAAALEGLDAEGVLSALVPTSFTSGLYFSKLRKALSSQAPLRDAGFVVDRDGTFADVLQETCLVVFTRKKARFTTIASLNGHIEKVARVKSPRGDGPWLLPRHAGDAATAAAAAELPLRLADVGYRCSTGPLVWNRRKADLAPARSRLGVPIVWAADIDGGTVHQDKSRDDRRFMVLQEGDEDVLVLSNPAVLVQRTTAPEQARRLVAADLSPDVLKQWGGRVVVENHVNVLRPTAEEPLLHRETLAAVLKSRSLDRVMRCLSGSVAVSAYELESLPFPATEVLHSWNSLSGEDLERSVTAAYRPKD